MNLAQYLLIDPLDIRLVNRPGVAIKKLRAGSAMIWEKEKVQESQDYTHLVICMLICISGGEAETLTHTTQLVIYQPNQTI